MTADVGLNVARRGAHPLRLQALECLPLKIRLVALTRYPSIEQKFGETIPFPRAPDLAIY